MEPITVIELVGGAGGAGGVLLMGAAANRAVKNHGVPALVWRWFTGHPLDGQHRTDATWLSKGRKQIHHPGRPISRWHYRPRLQRAGIRSGATWGLVATGYGLLVDPTLTEASMAGTASLGLSVVGWRAVQAILHWRHHRKFVEPMHLALAPRLGLDPAVVRPQEWMQIPRGFDRDDRDDMRISFDLPKDFVESEEARRIIAAAASSKLGLSDPKVSFELIGIAPKAVIKTSVPPPSFLGYAEILPLMEAASDTAPVLGVGRSRKTSTADLEAESPHILIQAGSGGGKSELIGLILAQQLHRGAVALILDIKRISHRWAKGLPSVKYCRDIEEIHYALMAMPAELKRRTGLVDECADINGDLPDDVNIGPRFWMVVEEMNTLRDQLQAYWQENKPKGAPALSPAIKAMNMVFFMGRAVDVNGAAVGQYLTDNVFGGPGGRANFATRCLARAPKSAYKMHAPDSKIRRSRHLGRWHVINADTATEIQAGYLTNEEKREYASNGVVTPFPYLEGLDEVMSQPVAVLTDSQSELEGEVLEGEVVSHTDEPVSPSLHVVKDGEQPELVGLREAVECGVVSISLDAVRWARANDNEFPPKRGMRGKEMLYSAAELHRWEANRERGGKQDNNEEAS